MKEQDARRRRRLGLLTVAAAILVLGTGLAMDQLEDHVKARLTDSRKILIPLSEMPTQIGPWVGRDEEPDDVIFSLTGMDEVRQIRFHRPGSGWVSTLITYSGRPRIAVGHYPDVCYPAVGWHIEYSKSILLRADDGQRIPAQLHFMTKFTENMYAQIYVVNTLIANGVVTTDKGAAEIRTVGQDRYQAQVQALFVGAESEEHVLDDAASLFSPLLQQLGRHFQGSELTMAGE
ncbi:MAG: exosortase-associated EpsI family protein [Phycisphaerales bacterium]|nr:exosortase-associated EpsI family protein [Phycisphaerales bacterium]